MRKWDLFLCVDEKQANVYSKNLSTADDTLVYVESLGSRYNTYNQ